MTKLISRFSNATRKSSIIRDDRGLSTVEYVIILVLIAAASVGTWKTLGGTVKGKIDASQQEINGVQVNGDGSNGAAKDPS